MPEFMPDIQPVRYEGPDTRNPLAFRYYNPREKVLGKAMADHLRFAVAYWHAFKGARSDPFGRARSCGLQQLIRSDGGRRADAPVRLRVLHQAGRELLVFHDRDIAPEATPAEGGLAETNRRLDQIVKLAGKLQKDTGVKLLWGTANLFSNRRYMAGAATNPSPAVFAYAAAQVKKALEITKELGGAGYVFWGGREGYDTLLNTDMGRELDHLAAFLHMAVDYKKAIGFKGQFYIEPKPKEPTKHQYDSTPPPAFLQKYDLADRLKLNIEANHATLAGHSFSTSWPTRPTASWQRGRQPRR